MGRAIIVSNDPLLQRPIHSLLPFSDEEKSKGGEWQMTAPIVRTTEKRRSIERLRGLCLRGRLHPNNHHKRAEKTEKHEYVFAGPLIGGLVFTVLGTLRYFFITNGFGVEILSALFFVLVGAIIIAAAVYGAVVAGRRHPKP
jgi:hypothetical protein